MKAFHHVVNARQESWLAPSVAEAATMVAVVMLVVEAKESRKPAGRTEYVDGK